MMDEEESLDATPHDRELLLYDYFKHLTSLCVLSLGGVLALADKGTKPVLLVAVLVVIGGAALLSFGGTSEIVRARFAQAKPSKYLNLYRIGTPTLLSIGLGMFLYIFIRTL
ncbi:hypothetical protein [Sphingomonas desiccabilis]|uniref:Uncharacterized protein n=1 Tax=Sphingomonas desiccabilis TaxID=429134 RepID=A0A4V1QP06_9SPHN|nr:hypothetical protein [Sphingomonas desiccabilis]MBB3911785.1 maltodextrin utilization protein YvdJ [Sphingomonas desiccabilis]RXZ31494.1 hypothetical protein EO081_09625 [Sphingomonas desiccabilis]